MSPRLAGDSPNYRFALMTQNPQHGYKWEPTENYFELPSVTTIIKDTLGIPAGAMSWYGFRIGMAGFAEMMTDAEAIVEATEHPEASYIEGMLKNRGCNPNVSLDVAGKRGNEAHYVLELLAQGKQEQAQGQASMEFESMGTRYCQAVIDWWDNRGFAPAQKAGLDIPIISEQSVWSLRYGYVGTFDLAVGFPDGTSPTGTSWEIIDLKTHKPASGFTKPGHGPAYISDIVQIRAYRAAFEEMGLGPTVAQRVLIARENGKWLEDDREVPFDLFARLLDVYRHKQEFEKEAADEGVSPG